MSLHLVHLLYEPSRSHGFVIISMYDLVSGNVSMSQIKLCIAFYFTIWKISQASSERVCEKCCQWDQEVQHPFPHLFRVYRTWNEPVLGAVVLAHLNEHCQHWAGICYRDNERVLRWTGSIGTKFFSVWREHKNTKGIICSFTHGGRTASPRCQITINLWPAAHRPMWPKVTELDNREIKIPLVTPAAHEAIGPHTCCINQLAPTEKLRTIF